MLHGLMVVNAFLRTTKFDDIYHTLLSAAHGEGMELDVLRMMNFDTFRPFAIICEMIEYKTKLGIPKKNTEILQYLRKKGYEEYAFTGINSIFIDQTALGGAAK